MEEATNTDAYNNESPISQKTSKKNKVLNTILQLLFVGSITILFGEVWTASSVNPPWFASIDTYLLFPLSAFTLYLVHFLFYFNLACKTGKTSIPHLYFWGILFGLYEAPITKVLWTLTGNEIGILGIDVIQFAVLVLFWHPIFSFITPILILQIFSKENVSITIISSHSKFLQKNTLFTKIWLILLLLTGVCFSSNTAYGYYELFIFTFVISASLPFLFYYINRFLNRKLLTTNFSLEKFTI